MSHSAGTGTRAARLVTDTSPDCSEWLGRTVRMSGDIVFVKVASDVVVPTLDAVLQLN